jgi:methyltransferase (TIGR00027 family)
MCRTIAKPMPGQFKGFGHRKIFIQQQVEAAIKQGARQVLVVGAGFDTLCLRLAPQHSDVQFFEVDHPATSAAKAKGVALEGQPANMIQIAADLGEQTLSRVLSEDGRWQSSLPSVILAEGLFRHLTDDEVRGLLGLHATRKPVCVHTRDPCLVNAGCSRSCSTSPENRGSPPFEARTYPRTSKGPAGR